MKTNMTKSFIIALLLSAFVAHPIFAELIDFTDDSAPGPAQEVEIEVPEEVNPPETSYDSDLIRHYTPERLKYLQECSEKTGHDCGLEVFDNMVDDTPLSIDCCRALLRIGQECHLGLVEFIFSTYEHRKIASEGVPRSKKTWNMCVSLVGDEIGAPVSLEN